MPIVVVCPCGRRLRAPDAMAGKRAKCPCGKILQVPEPEEPLVAELVEPPPEESKRVAPPTEPQAAEAELVSPSYSARDEVKDEHAESPSEAPRKRRKRRKKKRAPTTSERAPWRNHVHALLVLALIPLGVTLLQPDSTRGGIEERIQETHKNASPEVQRRLEQVLNSEKASLDDVTGVLPDGRLDGAFLPRKTLMHWAFAGLSAALFMGFILIIASPNDAHPLRLLGIGLFTGTIGILLLIAVQYIAAWTSGRFFVGRSIIVIFFYIAKFIGYSYQAALDPNNNFFLSLFGFTFGVGLCEELCKALPLLTHYRRRGSLGWRGAFLWGLASGAGFGVVEGIMYAGNFYNGVTSGSTYVVRFVSCVALHAIWSGSVGIRFYQAQALFDGDMAWYEYFVPLLHVLWTAMLLHGLYDTLLKKEMNALALVVAIASFLWLAWQVARMSSQEEEEPEAAPA